MIVGGIALLSGFTGVIGLGVGLLGVRVAWGVYVTKELDPEKKIVGRGDISRIGTVAGVGNADTDPNEFKLPGVIDLMMGKRKKDD